MIGRPIIEEQSADADLDALQTDVMRFMAIIAFSLLVIFIPLVRAIPERDTTSNLEVFKKNHKLEQEVRSLREMTISQGKQILNMMRKYASLKKESKGELSAVLGRLQGESKKSENQIQQLQSSIKQESIQNQQARKKLTELKKNYYAVKLKLIQLQKRYRMASKSKPKIQNAPVSTKAEKVQKVEQEKTEKVSKIQQAPPKTPRQEKTRVIFSSEGSLLELIENGDVKFYIFSSNNLFESYIEGSRILYRQLSKAPLTQYEMSCALVPTSIQKSIKQQLSNIIGASRRCFLTLSSGINKNLGVAVSKYKSGQFKIDRNGSVSHESIQ